MGIEQIFKINRELWDKENMVLNRYYKSVLTRTINLSDKIVDKFKKHINYNAEKDVIKILDEVFAECEYKETGDNLELLRTMFYILVIFGTLKKHKKMMLGVVLKSMTTDVFKTFEDFRVMWLRDVDNNVLGLEK